MTFAIIKKARKRTTTKKKKKKSVNDSRAYIDSDDTISTMTTAGVGGGSAVNLPFSFLVFLHSQIGGASVVFATRVPCHCIRTLSLCHCLCLDVTDDTNESARRIYIYIYTVSSIHSTVHRCFDFHVCSTLFGSSKLVI